jgi:hypothetical protein
MTTAQARTTPVPRPLPHCTYPGASDVASHGLQPLPDVLPLATLPAAMPHRSRRYRAVPADRLPSSAVLELARIVATSFARREPQCRHVRPPSVPPPALRDARHTDGFGGEVFGPWSTERLLYWFIRLLILTDPTSARSAVATNDAAIAQSLAILDDAGRVIGGALNDTLPPHGTALALRDGDPFLDAVMGFIGPVMELLATQDDESVAALSRFPEFAAAHAAGRVGHHFMVARSDALPTLDAFELVAATAERYRDLGFAYVIIEATNQWTGAACETLGATRVHFAPFRTRQAVTPSQFPLPHEPTSPDGYLARKDSGSMLYVLRLS